MDSKINLSQLTDLFAQASGMSRTASEQFVKTFFDIISDKVLAEGLVKVKGFGTFKLIQMEDRESVNVNTGERFTIEGHQKIAFVPDAELKDSINKPFASFETVEITSEQEQTLAQMEAEEKVVAAAPVVVPVKTDEETAGNGPQVQEVTPKRGRRIFLGILAWILSLILAIILLWILLWPLIGDRLVAMMDKSDRTELRANVINRDSIAAYKLQKEQELKAQSMEQEVSQTVEQPAAQSVAQSAAQPKQPAAQPKQSAQPAAQAKATATSKHVSDPYVIASQNPGVTQIFLMDEEDMERDLSSYSAADTVKYRVAGYLTTHELEPGETLTRLSLQYYGTKKLWPYIASYNGISDFSNMDPGAKIRIPKIAYRNNRK